MLLHSLLSTSPYGLPFLFLLPFVLSLFLEKSFQEGSVKHTLVQHKVYIFPFTADFGIARLQPAVCGTLDEHGGTGEVLRM